MEANPLHEGFAAQLMSAQYRAGRQADALATYQALRRRLRDELGLEPGPAVRDLEGRILRHELTVAPPVATEVAERQRRRVTVLSLDMSVGAAGLPQTSLDPEDELALVSPARQAARAQILHFGGVVLAEAGQGLTACFGYPARERSAESAVRAGLAISDLGASGEQALRTRIGIDTGVVVVEAVGQGGGTPELVGMAGEPLRAAADALSAAAASGEVLLGAETAVAVAGAIELEPARVGTRAVRIRNTGQGDLPGLIGREGAAADLARLASDADHRICMITVNGPAGIGKSALVDTFLAELGETWSTVRVRCDRRQSATPLHPFRLVLNELFDDGREPSERAVVSGLRRRWTAQPVLVVEDVDAADPATLEVLEALMNELANGLVLLTSRSRVPIELGGSTVPAVPIFTLDRAASRRLASEVAGGRRLDIETMNEIAERSGGVPLYVCALTRAVLDGGAQTSAVPATLYDSLMADVDRLGSARAAIQRCSVLGVTFAETDLERIGGAATVSSEHLATAVDLDVLVDEGHGQYRFSHELTATAAYESLLKSERLALHSAIADSFPALQGRAEPERLAYHLEAAGRTFDAAVAWRRASSHAITTNRHVAAQHHARRAIDLLDSLDAVLPDGGDNLRRALVNLAMALQATSHGSAELLQVIERVRASGLDEVDPLRGVVVGLIDVSNRQASGDFDGAERVARETLDAAERLDQRSAAFARQFLGASLVWRGRLDSGIAELEVAASYWDAEEVPAGPAARAFGALWSLLGLAAQFQDRPRDAAELFARARAMIPDDDGYGRCLVGATGATVDQLAGRVDVVRAAVEPLWSLAMDLSSDFWMRWAQMLLGWAVSSDRRPVRGEERAGDDGRGSRRWHGDEAGGAVLRLPARLPAGRARARGAGHGANRGRPRRRIGERRAPVGAAAARGEGSVPRRCRESGRGAGRARRSLDAGGRDGGNVRCADLPRGARGSDAMTDEELDHWRTVADDPADSAVAGFFESVDHDEPAALVALLVQHIRLPPEDQVPAIAEFLEAAARAAPLGRPRRRSPRGQAFFARFGVAPVHRAVPGVAAERLRRREGRSRPVADGAAGTRRRAPAERDGPVPHGRHRAEGVRARRCGRRAGAPRSVDARRRALVDRQRSPRRPAGRGRSRRRSRRNRRGRRRGAGRSTRKTWPARC